PAIAYHDRSNHALKLARHDASGWTVETVGTPARHVAGEWASLAFDAAGNAKIAFYDGSKFNASIVERGATGWTTTVVENFGNIRFTHTGWEKIESDAFRDKALGCFRDLLG